VRLRLRHFFFWAVQVNNNTTTTNSVMVILDLVVVVEGGLLVLHQLRLLLRLFSIRLKVRYDVYVNYYATRRDV